MYKHKCLGETMRNNAIFDNHTQSLFQAALPHIHPQAQTSINVILQANELVNTMQEVYSPPELSTMEINEEEQTPEVLLESIKEVCTPRENEFVDMILNFFKARKIYSAYQDYGSQVLQAAQVNHNRNPFNMGNLFGMGGHGNNGSIMDMLMSFLTPEQRNMFEMMNMMMSTMNMDNMNMGNMNMGNMNGKDSTANPT